MNAVVGNGKDCEKADSPTFQTCALQKHFEQFDFRELFHTLKNVIIHAVLLLRSKRRSCGITLPTCTIHSWTHPQLVRRRVERTPEGSTTQLQQDPS